MTFDTFSGAVYNIIWCAADEAAVVASVAEHGLSTTRNNRVSVTPGNSVSLLDFNCSSWKL